MKDKVKSVKKKSPVNRSVERLINKIWNSDDFVVRLDFKDQEQSIKTGHDCFEDNFCHGIEAFLRVLAAMRERGVNQAQIRFYEQ